MKKRVAIVIGTRPELIKMAPVMRALKKRDIPFILIHSNQHYSKELDENIAKNLKLKTADIHLHVGSGPHGAQTGRIMERVEQVFHKMKPALVLVHGDTNTTLAAALAAVKLHIPVGHVEAGLRSFDYSMPEEINRMLVDRISDFLFVPSVVAQKNLLKEGIQKSKTYITGNTVVDALLQHTTIAEKQSSVLQKNKLEHEGYILATAHRPENVDDKSQLVRVIRVFREMAIQVKKPVIFPCHPRTLLNLRKFKIAVPKTIHLLGPVDYLDMLVLIRHAALVLSDSGGLQEEAYLLKRPLMTIRTSTERPETLSANKIVGLDLKKAKNAWIFFQKHKAVWGQSLGKGDAAEKITEVLWQKLKNK